MIEFNALQLHVKDMKNKYKSFPLYVHVLIYFIIFTYNGARYLLDPYTARFHFATAYSDEPPKSSIVSQSFCFNNGKYIYYTPDNSHWFEVPLTWLVYGKVCNQAALFLVNVPYFLIMGFIIGLISKWMTENIPSGIKK